MARSGHAAGRAFRDSYVRRGLSPEVGHEEIAFHLAEREVEAAASDPEPIVVPGARGVESQRESLRTADRRDLVDTGLVLLDEVDDSAIG